MASLPVVKFKEFSNTGECKQFSCTASVDSQGEFHVTFPCELMDSVRANLPDSVYEDETRKKNCRVNGPVFDDCKKAIGDALKDYLKCDVTEELVIRYGQKTLTTYWKMPDGAIYASGIECKNDPNHDDSGNAEPKANGEWCGSLDASHGNAGYSVALFAKVQMKTTYSRPSGSKVKYGPPNFDNFSHQTWGERLDCFVGLREGGGFMRDGINLEEMPYTEEAAKFFYEMLIGMCAFSDKIDNFFAEPANVIEAIAGGVKLIGRDQ